MLDNINLNLLRSLHIILEECHVSRAAERLHISQSAVSRQLAQLREIYQDPILIRDRNKLIPTSKALEIKSRLDALILELNSILEDVPFEPSEYQGEFTFSSSDYVAQYIFPDIAKHLMSQAPRLDISFQLWEPSLINEISKFNNYLASSMFPYKPIGVSSTHLGTDKPVILMAIDHPLAQKPSLKIDDIIHYSHIKVTGGADKDSILDNVLAQMGQERRIAFKVPFFSAAIERLITSDFLMVLQEHIAINLKKHWNVHFIQLPFEVPDQHYWLIWHAKFDKDPVHKWLRAEVAKAIKSSIYSIGHHDLKS
ncbi:TPA: LysR family transcriptional regulator [Vibrio cholerae]|nr:LysR family transcriptional regulator [Vibrio cholerae]